MAQGMLGLFGNVRSPEEEDDKQREFALRYSGLTTPLQQNLYEIARGGQNMVEGARGLVGGGLSMATGKDVDLRTPGAQRAAKLAAVQEAMKGLNLDPNDPAALDKYYPALIRALGEQGLTAEAAEVVQEYQKMKSQAAKDALASKREERMTREGQAKLDLSRQRIELDAQKAQMVGPKAVQIVKQIEQYQQRLAQNPDDTLASDAIQNLKLALEQELAGKGFKLEKLNDRYVVVNTSTGDVREGGPMGEKPATEEARLKREAAKAAVSTALSGTMAALQARYEDAARLYAAPGLNWITGRFGPALELDRRSPTAEAALPGSGRNALALHDQVAGGAFLAGLQQLKDASKNGASGLGQVTEVEGAKVQASMAALRLSQDLASYRKNLAIYIKRIEELAQRLNERAAAEGLPARPFTAQPLPTAAGIYAPAKKPAPAAPAAAPKAPAATGGRPSLEDIFK